MVLESVVSLIQDESSVSQHVTLTLVNLCQIDSDSQWHVA